jgi:hypothetical protein
LGRTDIEDALKRLDSLIQEEMKMSIVQAKKATSELEDGAHPFRPGADVMMKQLSI